MSKEISRRDFLKGSAVAGAGLMFLRPSSGGGIFKAPMWKKDGKKHARNVSVGSVWYPSICTMCANTCGVKYAVKKIGGVERAVKIEGNPKHPYNLGKICARGQAGILRTYNPDRIKTPLIRVEGSKRGTWKFRKATWQEAYGYIMKKMQEKKIQPYEIAMAGGWITCAMYKPFIIPGALALAVPNILGTPIQHCVSSEHAGLVSVTGNFNVHAETIPDYGNADVILAFQSNASVAGIATGRGKRLGEALAKGAKLIVLDPRLSEMAAKATMWVPIKPGTDSAFILAMLRETIYGKHYDDEFSRSYTNAPFLAFEEKGMPIPAMEVNEKTGMPKAFFVYDEKSKKVVKVPAPAGSNLKDADGNEIKPALEAPDGLEWNGKKVKTVFQFLEDRVKDFTPEWAARITDIPVEKYKEIFDTFFSAKKPLIEPGWYGSRYANTTQARKAQAMIMALMGRIDTGEGAWNFAGAYREGVANFWETIWAGKKPSSGVGILMPLGMKKMFFDNPDAWPHKHPSVNAAWNQAQAKEGKVPIPYSLFGDMGYYEAAFGKLEWNGKPYRLRALFSVAANLPRSASDGKQMKEILEKMDLVVVSDILPTDMALYADVILPDYTYLEKGDPLFHAEMSPDAALVARRPLQPVPGVQAKHLVEVVYDLAAGMGAGEKYLGVMSKLNGWDPKVVMSEMERVKKGESMGVVLRDIAVKHVAKKTGKSYQELDKLFATDGVMVVETAEEGLKKAGIPRKYPTPLPSGRLEVYSLLFLNFVKMAGYVDLWDPLIAYVPPRWKEGMKDTDKPSGNEFFFAHGKMPLMSYTSSADNPLLMAMVRHHGMEGERFGLWMNTEKAKSLGIRDGDRVKVTNVIAPDYSIEIKAYLTEKVRPDTVFMVSSFGMESSALTYGFNRGVALNRLVPYRVDNVTGGYRANEFTVKVEKA